MPRLRDLQDRVLLGSDFPNIPYPYAHQLEALERLGLGEDWLRASAGTTPSASAAEPPRDAGRRRNTGCGSSRWTVRVREQHRLTTQEGLIGFDLGR